MANTPAGTASVRGLPRGGTGELLLKGPLPSPERHDRAAFEGRSGSERSTERGSSAKTVASQPGVGYPISARTAKKEILVKSLPNVSSPLLYDNVLYMVKDGGIVTAFDPQTGEVHKQARLRQAMERYFASPVAADGRIFMVSEGGNDMKEAVRGSWESMRFESDVRTGLR